MANSVLSKERLIAKFSQVVVEDDQTHANRFREELASFERRVEMTQGVVNEYKGNGTVQLHELFEAQLASFKSAPFKHRRWLSVLGLRIPIRSN